MRMATAQKLQMDDAEPLSTVSVSASPTTASAATSGAGDGDDGLPPPTKAQVFYWAQLCGELGLQGTAGIADADGWSADLAPSASTLKALQERGLVARRDRAWKLRRRWYERLTALKVHAVDTPVLGLAERPAPNLPTYAELAQWEAVCRWLDAQPGRRARLPFVGLVPLVAIAGGSSCRTGMDCFSGVFAVGEALLNHLVELSRQREEAAAFVGEHAALLRAMRRFRLVRHTQSCEWALSPKWREKVRDLHAGMNRALREYPSPQSQSAVARSLCAGLDTWALNWLVEDDGDGKGGGALPARLHRQLEDYQEIARAQEGEVETAWIYDNVPLRMYQAGVRAKGDGKKAKGVSWSFILVNPSLRLLIRRVPLGGIVANARLGSDCLWRLTERGAVDELHALLRRLWGKQRGRLQVSYAHLAHDVANAPLEREQLDRYVSRSRRQAVYDAAQAELARLLREARPRDAAGSALDGWEWDVADEEWDGLPLEEVFYDWEVEDGENGELPSIDAFDDGNGWDRTPWAVQHAKAELDGEAKERAITAYHWGQRLSGVTFSPGGAVSFVMYRKDWEGRLKQKRHMEPIWTAAGWDGKEPVTRHEARLVREPLRELRAAGSEQYPLLDDPWEFLEHLSEVWARMVGRADTCPEAVEVAWLRRVTPRDGESNRSRWDIDPVWRVVQQASFTPAPLAARRLVRRKQREQEVARLDKGILGYIAKREALLHPEPVGRDISLALRDLVKPLDRELAAKGEPFDQVVRRKRQEAGLPVPLPAKVLPLRPRADGARGVAERQVMVLLEQPLAEIAVDEALDEAASLPLCGVDAAGGGDDSDDSGELAPCEGSWQLAHWRRWAELRARSAELRMRQAYAALEVAEMAEVVGHCTEQEVERLAACFAREAAAYAAADETLARLGDVGFGDGGRSSA
jgi:hypothetical protein